MSTVPTAPKRHALGLPAGSIRATHTLFIVGLFCAMLLIPTREPQPVPPYLIYLLFMVLGHYFAHRSAPPTGEHHPLFLPPGFIRFVVMAALIATVGWCLYHDPDKLNMQFEKSLDALKLEPFLPLCILGAFFVGVIVRAVVGREDPPYFLQDMEAWISLISIVGLCVAVIIHLIIMPTLENAVSMPLWEGILASVIAFYFGERS
jgi:hypothetical protein